MDTSFAGALKGVGKVDIQTVLDYFSRFVRARLCPSTMQVTAVQILNNHGLPFFEQHRVKVPTILSDNGREYCGRPDKHPYEFFLQLEFAGPQSNGFIERFHRTLIEEHLQIKGRTTRMARWRNAEKYSTQSRDPAEAAAQAACSPTGGEGRRVD